MMSNWHCVSSGSSLGGGSSVTPLTALSCDPCHELVWSGSEDGYLTSMHAPLLDVRSRIAAHRCRSSMFYIAPLPPGGAIAHLRPTQQPQHQSHSRNRHNQQQQHGPYKPEQLDGVLSASSCGVRVHGRGGRLHADLDCSELVGVSPRLISESGHRLTSATQSADGYTMHMHEMMIAAVTQEDSDSSSIVTQAKLGMLDLNTGQISSQCTLESAASCMGLGRVLACGGSSPSLAIHDPRTLSQIRTLPGHQGGTRQVVIKGDRLVSVGYTTPPSDRATRMYGGMSSSMGRIDPTVRVYDVRTFRPLTPITFPMGGGPISVCFLPNFTSTIVLCSYNGVWQLVDAENGIPAREAYQLTLTPGSFVSAPMSMSSNGECIAFGDSMGQVHLWSDKIPQHDHLLDEIRLNAYSLPVDYVPPAEEAPVQMDEWSPLTMLPPEPYYAYADPSLDPAPLSDLPRHPAASFFPPPYPPIDDKLLHLNYHIQYQDYIGYIASNAHIRGATGGGMGMGMGGGGMGRGLGGGPSGGHALMGGVGGIGKGTTGGHGFLPNHLPTLYRFCAKGRNIEKLRKKKTLGSVVISNVGGKSGIGGVSTLSPDFLRRDLLISREYARVTLKMPRFGSFDFRPYNRTNFTGLDNLLPNSYVNPVIQLLYFMPLVRRGLRKHLCEKENCLMCELGFLFHMLDTGGGLTAEPRNFLRALRQLPEATGLGLLDMNENTTTIQSTVHASAAAGMGGSKGKAAAGLLKSGGSKGGSNGSSTSSSASDDDELFLASKIQDFFRFILEQLHQEERESSTFQNRLAESQAAMQQRRYNHAMAAQRRSRQWNVTLSQMQGTVAQIIHEETEANNATGGNVAANHESINQFQAQFQHFSNEFNHQFDETERMESQLLHLQLAAMETNLEQEVSRTMMQRVFASQLQVHTYCQGSATTQPHTTVNRKDVLHFKLHAYPSHETDCTFDALLTNSLRHDPGGVGAAGGFVATEGAATGLATQRLFCNHCSTFTIQASCKSIHPPMLSPLSAALEQISTNIQAAAASAQGNPVPPPPVSCHPLSQCSFPECLTIMCNVQTDLQWEWWKRKDERFQRARSLIKAKTQTSLAQQAKTGQATGTAAATRPTNLYNRFLAAASNKGKNNEGGVDEAASATAPPAPSSSPSPPPEYELRPGVVNAKPKRPSSSNATGNDQPAPPSASHSASASPPTAPRSASHSTNTTSFSHLSDDYLDSQDVHFLPHYILLFNDGGISSATQAGRRETLPSDPIQTRAFRVLPSYARQLKAHLDAIHAAHTRHHATLSSLHQSLLSAHIALSHIQQQVHLLHMQAMCLSRQASIPSTQLNHLYDALRLASHEAQQLQSQGHPVPIRLQRQIQSMQGSAAQLESHIQQLEAQRMSIDTKARNIQMSGLGAAAAASTGSAASMSAWNGYGVAQLQNQISMLDLQLQTQIQQFASHKSAAEEELRRLICTQLSSATQSATGLAAATSYSHTSIFDPALVSHLRWEDVALYELTGVLAHIADPPEKDSPLHSINGEHLVAHIKITREERAAKEQQAAANKDGEGQETKEEDAAVKATPQRRAQPPTSSSFLTSPQSPTTNPASVPASESDDQWFVFNDFVIRPSHGMEATRFSYIWKQPCAVMFKRISPTTADAIKENYELKALQALIPGLNRQALSVRSPRGSAQPVESNPFMHDMMLYSYTPSLSLRYHDSRRSFVPLVPPTHGSDGRLVQSGELMDRRSLVAIDCEFVCVQEPLMETNEETKEEVVVRPARLVLARVSVVRGEGPMMGVPFIDDYIATSEPVVDYLTRFSGLSPGDLDRSISTHYLTTMKHAYVKLRALIERGVTFIGHGLKKDFQMLNLFVPATQIFDTVDLFSLPNQRKLSLRFLAVHLLQTDIQQQTHDSIEDARTALQLYHKYRELKQKGTLEQTIRDLYATGHRAGFKV